MEEEKSLGVFVQESRKSGRMVLPYMIAYKERNRRRERQRLVRSTDEVYQRMTNIAEEDGNELISHEELAIQNFRRTLSQEDAHKEIVYANFRYDYEQEIQARKGDPEFMEKVRTISYGTFRHLVVNSINEGILRNWVQFIPFRRDRNGMEQLIHVMKEILYGKPDLIIRGEQSVQILYRLPELQIDFAALSPSDKNLLTYLKHHSRFYFERLRHTYVAGGIEQGHFSQYLVREHLDSETGDFYAQKALQEMSEDCGKDDSDSKTQEAHMLYRGKVKAFPRRLFFKKFILSIIRYSREFPLPLEKERYELIQRQHVIETLHSFVQDSVVYIVQAMSELLSFLHHQPPSELVRPAETVGSPPDKTLLYDLQLYLAEWISHLKTDEFFLLCMNALLCDIYYS